MFNSKALFLNLFFFYFFLGGNQIMLMGYILWILKIARQERTSALKIMVHSFSSPSIYIQAFQKKSKNSMCLGCRSPRLPQITRSWWSSAWYQKFWYSDLSKGIWERMSFLVAGIFTLALNGCWYLIMSETNAFGVFKVFGPFFTYSLL